MSGVDMRVDLGGLTSLASRIETLAGMDTRGLLDAAGAEIESQTHRRIRSEKTSPDGMPWQDWSPGYAATRHAGHSLLMGEGDLDDSIQQLMSIGGDETEVGSNLIYAAIHQFGGAEAGKPEIPERRYLGLSDENEADLVAVVDDWIAEQLGGILQ